MMSPVLSVSPETSIVTEAFSADFAIVDLAPNPEAYPSSSEDQAFYFLGRQDEEDTPSFEASQHNVDSKELRLDSSTYSFTDTQAQESRTLGDSILPFHQNPGQLPGLVFHEYTTDTTNVNNAEFATHDNYASYGDRYQLRLSTCVLKRDEAELVRHFFSGFSDAFDLGDPDRSFSSWFSTRVLQYPRLLESILSIASRHLGRGSTCAANADSAAEASSNYIRGLPSVSSNIGCSMAEIDSVTNLLSRFAQSMEGQYLNSQYVVFTLVWSIFVVVLCSIPSPSIGQANTIEEPAELFVPESLPEAAWWGSLRLEAYLAIVNQAPLPSYLDALCADNKGAPVDDKDWTNLMLLHLTDIIRYCFSDNRDKEHYAALLKDITIWSETKPDSFDPIYTCNQPEKQVLPDIWLYSEPVAAGLQYYHLGRMLLLSHDPRLPKIGLARNRKMKQIEV
ncbi:ARCA-like protein [Fusarium napiforme]|uniref:ARCA-like protein n=1 Tax=Fusarium napiforme TaxID=42672 RepID=A0A8H5JNJ0_9HYPO|nr:ARCA-like protein [Fusarium napiforme]